MTKIDDAERTVKRKASPKPPPLRSEWSPMTPAEFWTVVASAVMLILAVLVIFKAFHGSK